MAYRSRAPFQKTAGASSLSPFPSRTRRICPCPRSSARACSSARLCKRRRRPWTQTRGATPSSPPSPATLPLRRRRRRSLALEPSFIPGLDVVPPVAESYLLGDRLESLDLVERGADVFNVSLTTLRADRGGPGSTLFGDLSFRVGPAPPRLPLPDLRRPWPYTGAGLPAYTAAGRLSSCTRHRCERSWRHIFIRRVHHAVGGF